MMPKQPQVLDKVLRIYSVRDGLLQKLFSNLSLQ